MGEIPDALLVSRGVLLLEKQMAIPDLPGGFNHLPGKSIYFPQKDTYAGECVLGHLPLPDLCRRSREALRRIPRTTPGGSG